LARELVNAGIPINKVQNIRLTTRSKKHFTDIQQVTTYEEVDLLKKANLLKTLHTKNVPFACIKDDYLKSKLKEKRSEKDIEAIIDILSKAQAERENRIQADAKEKAAQLDAERTDKVAKRKGKHKAAQAAKQSPKFQPRAKPKRDINASAHATA